MMLDPQQILSLARRHRLELFVIKAFETLHPGKPPLQLAWYLQAICQQLEQVWSGEVRRTVITVPPRHLKSITVAVAFVAWVLGHRPGMKLMVASYSQDLARHHSHQTRTIMESDWYKNDFPGTRIRDGGNRALELVTTAEGCRKAVSVTGTTTGFGADIIIVDDCMKADEARSEIGRTNVKEWYDGTLASRLNDKSLGPVISIQQRLHEDDLPAYLLDKGFEHLNLPAIGEKDERIALGNGRWHHRKPGDLLDPVRENKETLDQLRRELGPAVFAAQYQQDPVAPDGNLLRWEWFKFYDKVPERSAFQKVVQSWDTGMSAAPTSHWSVCTTWGFRARKWYLLDVFRRRLDYPDLRAAVIRLQESWQADKVIIEDACSGKSLWQDLRASGPFRPLMTKPWNSKEERFVGTLGEVEAGNILLPTDAPWLDAFRAELKAFPNGAYNDQVDSFSQAVLFQINNWRWAMTERQPDGRAVRLVRDRKRPW
ncbi:MAG: phage terminase large subunit [Sphingomicrobium sp.]